MVCSQCNCSGHNKRTCQFLTIISPAEQRVAAELGAILYQCVEALRIASVLLHPVMPAKMDELHAAISSQMPAGDTSASLTWGGMKAGTKVSKVALFPRVEYATSE